ncbi:MAG: cyclic nucleotide-binding domain-containing protein [Proteobacteria bacterium]|nr:cyclic nucleotide-binding domain-containing protein [Pseudomonadota bacterium]
MKEKKITRLQEGLNKLLSGHHEFLCDTNISRALPGTIIRLMDNNKSRIAEKLVEQIIIGLHSEDPKLRKNSAGCLTETANLLAGADNWEILKKLLPSLREIVRMSNAADTPELRGRIQATAANILNLAASRAAQEDERSQAAAQKTAAPPAAKDPLAAREEEIFQLAARGEKDEAKKQLFDLIISCARKKDFTNAERLRERIYEIDPLALMEIIQSGEIIEEEKSGAISRTQLQVWSKLLNEFTPEEFNAIYHEMEERTYKPEEVVVAQGDKNDELFFINQGSLKATYKGGQKEFFLKNLHSGEIAGECFFNATIWTMTLTALEVARLSILKREDLMRQEEKFPGLESKLRDFYNRTSDIHSLLDQKGMDRRNHERYKLERRINLQIIDQAGKPISSFRGEMFDIAQGGLSFIVRISKKENSRLLLGRNIKATIPMSGAREHILTGTVICVQSFNMLDSDFSVHIKFDVQLDRSTLHTILE